MRPMTRNRELKYYTNPRKNKLYDRSSFWLPLLINKRINTIISLTYHRYDLGTPQSYPVFIPQGSIIPGVSLYIPVPRPILGVLRKWLAFQLVRFRRKRLPDSWNKHLTCFELVIRKQVLRPWDDLHISWINPVRYRIKCNMRKPAIGKSQFSMLLQVIPLEALSGTFLK